MSKQFSTTALLPVLSFGLALLVSSSGAPGTASAPSPAANKYIGAEQCKDCHDSKESGNTFEAWSNAKHSNAFEVLKSAESKELAAKVGIDDPATADACVECHVTGFGEPESSFKRDWDRELGVQCETCHGPGDDHRKARFKAAAMGKKSSGYDPVPAGEIIVAPGVDTCVKCHNPKSPSYQPFCFFEARAKVAHLDPRKGRTEEEIAEWGRCPSGDPCQHADGCPDGKCNLKPDELAAMRK
jgi:hypothetical protein